MSKRYSSKLFQNVRGEHCNKIFKANPGLSPHDYGPTEIKVVSNNLTDYDKLFVEQLGIKLTYNIFENMILSTSANEKERLINTHLLMNMVVDDSKVKDASQRKELHDLKQWFLDEAVKLEKANPEPAQQGQPTLNQVLDVVQEMFGLKAIAGGGKSKFRGQAGQQFRRGMSVKRALEYKQPQVRTQRAKGQEEFREYLRQRRAALKEVRDTYACWARSTAEHLYETDKEFERSLKLDADGNVDIGDTFARFAQHKNIRPSSLGHSNIFLGLIQFFKEYKGLRARYNPLLISLFLLSLLASVTFRVTNVKQLFEKAVADSKGVVVYGDEHAPSPYLEEWAGLEPGARRQAMQRGRIMGKFVNQVAKVKAQKEKAERDKQEGGASPGKGMVEVGGASAAQVSTVVGGMSGALNQAQVAQLNNGALLLATSENPIGSRGAVVLSNWAAQAAAIQQYSAGQMMVANAFGTDDPGAQLRKQAAAVLQYKGTAEKLVHTVAYSDATKGLPILTEIASITTVMGGIQAPGAKVEVTRVSSIDDDSIQATIQGSVAKYLKRMSISGPAAYEYKSVEESVAYMTAFNRDGGRVDSQGWKHEVGNVYIITQETSTSTTVSKWLGLADEDSIGGSILGIYIVVTKQNVNLAKQIQERIDSLQSDINELDKDIFTLDNNIEDLETAKASIEKVQDFNKATANQKKTLYQRLLPKWFTKKNSNDPKKELDEALSSLKRDKVAKVAERDAKVKQRTTNQEKQRKNEKQLEGVLHIDRANFQPAFRNIVTEFLKRGRDERMQFAIDTCTNVDLSITNVALYKGAGAVQYHAQAGEVWKQYVESHAALQKEFFNAALAQCLATQAKGLEHIAREGMALIAADTQLTPEGRQNAVALVQQAQQLSSTMALVNKEVLANPEAELAPLVTNAIAASDVSAIQGKHDAKAVAKIAAAVGEGLKQAGDTAVKAAKAVKDTADAVPTLISAAAKSAIPFIMSFGAIFGLQAVYSGYVATGVGFLPMGIFSLIGALIPTTFSVGYHAWVSNTSFGDLFPLAAPSLLAIFAMFKLLRADKQAGVQVTALQLMCAKGFLRRNYSWEAGADRYMKLDAKKGRSAKEDTEYDYLRTTLSADLEKHIEEYKKASQKDKDDGKKCLSDHAAHLSRIPELKKFIDEARQLSGYVARATKASSPKPAAATAAPKAPSPKPAAATAAAVAPTAAAQASAPKQPSPKPASPKSAAQAAPGSPGNAAARAQRQAAASAAIVSARTAIQGGTRKNILKANRTFKSRR
jgi:hypothetical protein